MKKDKKVLLLLCAFCILFLCTLTSTGCSNSSNDKEFIAAGETTLIENPTKAPSAYTANQQLYILAWQLKTVNSYKAIVVGETESKMPKYVQHINDLHIKNGDESYSEAKSTSFLVNVGKQAFFKGDKVVCREATDVTDNAWSEELNVTTLKDFRSKIGSEATALTNYILNDDTILSAESRELDNGNFQITASIDPEAGTSRYKAKMMNFGGLKSLPKFNSCNFTLTFTKDWLPIELVSIDDYNVDKGILKLHCMSNIREIFTNFDKVNEIPNADIFRNKINEEASELDEDKVIEGSELLFNTILQMDTSKGIKINGTLDAEMNGKNVVVPVDGWMTFDFNNYPNGDLNQIFTGRVSTNLNNLPLNIYYIGDNNLYVNLGNTKYKYPLTGESTDENISFSEIISTLVVEEGERNGNFREFKLSLSPIVISTLGSIINNFAKTLPESFANLRDLTLNDLNAGITLIKKSPSTARVTEVSANADFGIAKGSTNVLIAEKPETLPTADELSDYVEADWNNIINNFNFITKFVSGIEGYDWLNGTGFTLSAGLQNEASPLIFDLPAEAQVKDGFKFHFTFGLGALMKLPSEFYLSNTNFYIVTTNNIGTDKYAGNVDTIDILEKLSSLLPNIIKGGVNPDAIFNTLASIALDSKVVNTKLEDGTERVELFLPQELVKTISVFYNKLIAKAKGADLGAMGAIVGALLAQFEFDLEDVIITTEYQENKLTLFSLRLKNNEKNCAVLISLKGFNNQAAGVIENNFAIIDAGLKAMEESKDVRALVDAFINKGLTHLGDSFNNSIKSVEDAYNKLSTAAKQTVMKWADFNKIKADYTKFVTDANKFIDTLVKIEALEKETGKDADIYKLFNETLNPLYNKLNGLQKEYIGKYALDKYLEKRANNETTYAVNYIMSLIDQLTKDNYPTSDALNKAINDANSKYLNLLEENRALVTNYNKISEAKKVAHDLEIAELDVKMKEVVERVKTYNVNTTIATFNTEKSKITNLESTYNGLKDEEKALIKNFKDFSTAKENFFKLLGDAFTASYNKIGGIDKVVKGDECFNLIDYANKIKNLLTPEQKTAYKTQLDDLAKCVTKHRELETNEIKDLIAAIGTVSFTNECHEKILKARHAYENIRKTYANSVANRSTLQNAEANYIKLSIDGLTVENVTIENKEAINLARTLYDDLTKAYSASHLSYFKRGINNKLTDFVKTLTELEAKVK